MLVVQLSAVSAFWPGRASSAGGSTARGDAGEAAGTPRPPPPPGAAAACPAPSLEAAHACLRLTTPALELAYPADAEAHFAELQRALAPWWGGRGRRPHTAGGFGGPGVENVWIRHFWDAAAGRPRGRGGADCLAATFGPFIPLLVPWTDVWVAGDAKNGGRRMRYPPGLLAALRGALRPDVPYLTLSQNDEGLAGKCVAAGAPATGEGPSRLAARPAWALEFDHAREFPNLLVLSAGGYGHVPIPLFKQDERALTGASGVAAAVGARPHLVSFVGTLKHAPRRLREEMAAAVRAEAAASNFSAAGFGRVAEWRALMAESALSLAPRGFGRSSYHLVEALQMGVVPIHVYSDVAWVPYARVFETVGFVARVAELPALLARLRRGGARASAELAEREARARALRESHFDRWGLMRHVEGFMTGRPALANGAPHDLVCQPLPASVRDADETCGAPARRGRHRGAGNASRAAAAAPPADARYEAAPD